MECRKANSLLHGYPSLRGEDYRAANEVIFDLYTTAYGRNKANAVVRNFIIGKAEVTFLKAYIYAAACRIGGGSGGDDITHFCLRAKGYIHALEVEVNRCAYTTTDRILKGNKRGIIQKNATVFNGYSHLFRSRCRIKAYPKQGVCGILAIDCIAVEVDNNITKGRVAAEYIGISEGVIGIKEYGLARPVSGKHLLPSQVGGNCYTVSNECEGIGCRISLVCRTAVVDTDDTDIAKGDICDGFGNRHIIKVNGDFGRAACGN